MSNQITSQVLGQLMQEEDFPDWWRSEAKAVPFLDNKKLPVILTGYFPGTDEAFIPEADIALANFLALNISYRESIAHLLYKNYKETLEGLDLDEDDPEVCHIKDEQDVWNFIHANEAYVQRRHRRDENIYIMISCECDWEEEHGLQLVFRQGKS